MALKKGDKQKTTAGKKKPFKGSNKPRSAKPVKGKPAPQRQHQPDRKNVSFASNLEESRLIEEVDSVRTTPSNNPRQVRSILKTRAVRGAKEKPSEAAEQRQAKPLKAGKKKIVVKKSVKEHLLTLDRKERREYLRNLRAKRKPLTGLALEAKHVWEKLRM